MGTSWSSVSECLGDFSHGQRQWPYAVDRPSRLSASRRVESVPSSQPNVPPAAAGRGRGDRLDGRASPAATAAAPGATGAMMMTTTTTTTTIATTTTATTTASATSLRHRTTSDEKLVPTPPLPPPPLLPSSCGIASQEAAPPHKPPPLIPDPHAVYDLLDDETEDVCPTCLETYADDNPRIDTTCGHAFHLQCIVEWETRSGSSFCPICAKVMGYAAADGARVS